MTVEDLIRGYTAQLEAEGAVVDKIRSQLRPVVRHLGAVKLEDLRTSSIEDYRTLRLRETTVRGGPPEQSTLNRELGYLRAALRRALEEERVDRIPRFRMRSEAASARTDWCRQGTLEKLVEHLIKRHPVLADVILFAFLTGWRKGEVLKLTWDEVRLVDGVMTLQPRRNKGRKVRLFPIQGKLGELLQRRVVFRVEGCPYVFHRAGVKIEDFRKAWLTATKVVGEPGLKIHGFRRSFATYQMRAGVPVAVTMALAGWATDSIYRRYAIVDQAAQLEGLRRFEEYLEGARKITPCVP